MTRKLCLLALPLLLASAACTADPASDESFSTELTGTLELDVRFTWNAGEGSEADPPPEGVVFDEDEWAYVYEGRVALGPMQECAKRWEERDPAAVCSWDLPSEWWSADLSIVDRGGVPMLDFDVFAGDADTDGGTALPLASVPSAGAWTFSFSPDNAGGGWGDISFSITRVAADAPPPTDGACCAMCTTGVACGDSCIPAGATCSQPAGCACDG